MDKITANYKDINEDGLNAASAALEKAISDIDSKFGYGYAKDNPGLIGAYMNTSVKYTQCLSTAKTAQELALVAKESLIDLANQLNNIFQAINDNNL